MKKIVMLFVIMVIVIFCGTTEKATDFKKIPLEAFWDLDFCCEKK